MRRSVVAAAVFTEYADALAAVYFKAQPVEEVGAHLEGLYKVFDRYVYHKKSPA